MDNGLVATVYRGNAIENMHHLSFALSSQTDCTQKKFLDSNLPAVFLRSAAKPFQAYALWQHPQAQQDLSAQEWAIICSSHNGAPNCIALVQDILKRANIGEDALQCGPHAPLDPGSAKDLLCRNKSPRAIHNNCSGKHAGMLLACRYNGWPIESYLAQTHPLQQQISKILSRYAAISPVEFAIDGCGAPVARIPLHGVAKLFESLVTHPELKPLTDVMTTYPDLIGDAQRIDSALMKVSNGNLVAKVGADGMLGIGNRQQQTGLVLKCHDGNNAIRDVAALYVLEALDWLSVQQLETLRMDKALDTLRYNTQQKVVGDIRFEFGRDRFS